MTYILPADDYQFSWTQKGWECPRCGRILAPWMPNCTCERQSTFVYPGVHTDTTTAPKSPTSTTTTYKYTPKEHSYSMSVCDSCKYIHVPFTHYPCSNCYDHDKYIEWKE